MSIEMGVATRARLDAWLDRRRRNRRRLKYGLLGLVLLAVVPLQWISRRAVRHYTAASRLEPTGVDVTLAFNSNNWLEGGESSVVFENRYFFLMRSREASDAADFGRLIRVTRIDASQMDHEKPPDFAFLAFTPHLKVLRVDRSVPRWPGWPTPPPFGDEILTNLPGLASLRSLEVAGNRITDAGAARIARAGSIEELDLSHTLVTDVGLKKLRSLRNLSTLKLSGSRVTPAGVAALQAAKPMLEIDYDPKVKPFHAD